MSWDNKNLTFSEAQFERYLEALRGGNYRTTAASYAGIATKVMDRWMREGRTGSDPFAVELYRRAKRAEVDAEIELVSVVNHAATSDPRHAEWMLARRYPERWGSGLKRGGLRVPAAHKEIRQDVSDEELLRVLLEATRNAEKTMAMYSNGDS